GSQPHKVSTQGCTEILIFLFRVDNDHLQASLALLQEFAHDAYLVEVGFTRSRDGPAEFMRVVQRLAPLVDCDRFAVGSNPDQHARWHEEGVADKREGRGQATTVQRKSTPQFIACLGQEGTEGWRMLISGGTCHQEQVAQ